VSAWFNKFLNALEVEFVDIKLIDHLDDILTWIGEGDSNKSYVVLEEKYGSLVLFKRLEDFLDGLVLVDSAINLMFPLSLSVEDAKKRYRKLIRIFHPDREKGANSQVWLNYRAEKINKAYREYLDAKKHKPSTPDLKKFSKTSASHSVKKAKPKKGVFKPKFKYRSSVWRERLGNPKEFQHKVVGAFVAFAILLLIFVYFTNKQAVNQFGSYERFEKRNDSTVSDVLNYEEYVLDGKSRLILDEADEFLRFVDEDNDSLLVDEGGFGDD